jgi:hypothetical protein
LESTLAEFLGLCEFLLFTISLLLSPDRGEERLEMSEKILFSYPQVPVEKE